MTFKKISVIGLGYIGLPTAAAFASKKIKVIGIDVTESVVKTINKGQIHIVEPDLDIMVKTAVDEGFLRASIVPEAADAFLIAVPTPFINETESGQKHKPDLSYIKSATKAIATVLKKGDLVILESTSPVGATEKMMHWLAEERADLTFPKQGESGADVFIAHCPERVLPGQVIRELVENDRLIGGITNDCSMRAIELYKIFVEGECVVTNARTAEMAKLTENASRDVSIAFANELSLICDDLDINVWELIKLANRHPRVNILQPGPGVGGHCIAVDPWFIVSKSPEKSKLIHQARLINDSKPDWVIQKIIEKVKEFLIDNPEKSASDVSIALYGLAFKPDIDDLRESPALSIAQELNNQLSSTTLLVIEPNITKLPDSLSNYALVSFEEGIHRADIHTVLVDHKEFHLKKALFVTENIVDTKGLLENH